MTRYISDFPHYIKLIGPYIIYFYRHIYLFVCARMCMCMCVPQYSYIDLLRIQSLTISISCNSISTDLHSTLPSLIYVKYDEKVIAKVSNVIKINSLQKKKMAVIQMRRKLTVIACIFISLSAEYLKSFYINTDYLMVYEHFTL